jgi:hypothetical protein
MSAIKLSTPSSGSISLSPANTASNLTITVPAVNATMATLTTPSFATTIGVGGATPAASGAGITFPATKSPSSDANTLDDYEEGTFTPSWSATGVTFSYDGNYRHGRYTKIGNTVYFSVYISTSSAPTGTTSNTVRISGLPFTAGNTDNANACGCSYGQLWNVDWQASKNAATAAVSRNASTIDLRWEQDSAVSSDWIASALLSQCYVIVTGFYFV